MNFRRSNTDRNFFSPSENIPWSSWLSFPMKSQCWEGLKVLVKLASKAPDHMIGLFPVGYSLESHNPVFVIKKKLGIEVASLS